MEKYIFSRRLYMERDRLNHQFSYNWRIKDVKFKRNKGKVMSCFCCGGGSSFGYLLAGYDVVACNEIDPKVMKMYLKNHDVKYAFNCDIRELIANINMGGAYYERRVA